MGLRRAAGSDWATILGPLAHFDDIGDDDHGGPLYRGYDGEIQLAGDWVAVGEAPVGRVFAWWRASGLGRPSHDYMLVAGVSPTPSALASGMPPGTSDEIRDRLAAISAVEEVANELRASEDPLHQALGDSLSTQLSALRSFVLARRDGETRWALRTLRAIRDRLEPVVRYGGLVARLFAELSRLLDLFG